jgi:hypothetical protein
MFIKMTKKSFFIETSKIKLVKYTPFPFFLQALFYNKYAGRLISYIRFNRRHFKTPDFEFMAPWALIFQQNRRSGVTAFCGALLFITYWFILRLTY